MKSTIKANLRWNAGKQCANVGTVILGGVLVGDRINEMPMWQMMGAFVITLTFYGLYFWLTSTDKDM
jgi:hypothetical protein